MIYLFKKYLTVGVINTLLHWLVFALFIYIFDLSQAVVNVIAFCIAVTFSFFANAKFTFKKKATGIRYLFFIFLMGILSYLTGIMADMVNFPPIITLISFSFISLIIGFIFSKFFIFKGIE